MLHSKRWRCTTGCNRIGAAIEVPEAMIMFAANRPQPSMPKKRSFFSKVILLLLIVAAVVLVNYFRTHENPFTKRAHAPKPGFPEIEHKQEPREIVFDGCPPEGDGGDPELNRLKNRVDEGKYLSVDFGVLIDISWPRDIERERRGRWSQSDREDVEQYEGTPVSVEGYLAGAKEEGPESPNCHGEEGEMRDFHLWLVKNADDDRSQSMVVEVTPRIRKDHPRWDLDDIRKLVKDGRHVRVSGWLMLDPEHPDQVGKTRGTIWEIHPIMKIEVENHGAWKALDDIAA